ncbi:MAG: hypothetical protein RLZ98_233 [Pseudomonadota bacterium]
MTSGPRGPPGPKNRFHNAPRQADYTIDQDWSSYTKEEHDRWDRLFARQASVLQGRACDAHLQAKKQLVLSASGIPNFGELSSRLEPLTGWRVVPVAELVPDDVFFSHLANRRFPAGAFIRPEEEFDYLREPDVFHDVFGHVPLLANRTFADFMAAYGAAGLRAQSLGCLHNLARLYWYTVEFGLLQSKHGLRIFGAGILSSPAETVFSLDDPSPHRIEFDLFRIMRTNYIIDDFQKSYFVIASFENLLAQCEQDFDHLYASLRTADDIDPHQTIADDRIVSRGNQGYFNKRQTSSGPA